MALNFFFRISFLNFNNPLIDSIIILLHFQVHIICDEFSEEVYKRIEPFIYDYTAKLRGSISAEHGIGFQKKNYLKKFKQPEALHLMKELKSVMDPNRILNPYKVLCD